MESTIAAFRSVIELCKISGLITSLPMLVFLLLHKGGLRFSPGEKSAAKTVMFWVYAIFLFPAMLGTGSCVVGGFVAGQGICELTVKGRQGPLDPVINFWHIQIFYTISFLLSAFLFVMMALALLPGSGSAWQRFTLLITFGRRGKWT